MHRGRGPGPGGGGPAIQRAGVRAHRSADRGEPRPANPEDAHRRRYLYLSKVADGSIRGRFACGPAQALTLTAVLAALGGPQPGKAVDADGVERDVADERSTAERHMDALIDAIDHHPCADHLTHSATCSPENTEGGPHTGHAEGAGDSARNGAAEDRAETRSTISPGGCGVTGAPVGKNTPFMAGSKDGDPEDTSKSPPWEKAGREDLDDDLAQLQAPPGTLPKFPSHRHQKVISRYGERPVPRRPLPRC